MVNACLTQREAAAENTKHLTPLAYSGDYVTQHLPVHHRLETHYDSITDERELDLPRFHLGNVSCKSSYPRITLPR